jgi:hypothetical protein
MTSPRSAEDPEQCDEGEQRREHLDEQQGHQARPPSLNRNRENAYAAQTPMNTAPSAEPNPAMISVFLYQDQNGRASVRSS